MAPANLLQCQWNKNHDLVMPPEVAVRVTESHGAHTKAQIVREETDAQYLRPKTYCLELIFT